ncbi:uracil-DNA glycosylase family protein [Olleya sp. YS]|uniref:uracil-DNA glycosylase family protein n=1 Tax=Olleya sp. YS TaxID=3028318 RepID=UPI0024344A10|nr:uracil-DNA glycosylase family protein [Olleya sp. YS]WGD35898.1 uracil-DNA glycosylase family protein [Olleya sp. YS]
MKTLLQEISHCILCKQHLPLGPKPIVEASINSKIILISQAPGQVAHRSGTAWDDAGGKRLKAWLDVTETQFYNPNNFAIIPMGFCYPGKGKTGDLPPRKECAPEWHDVILQKLSNIKLIILIGAYAQNYYLKETSKRTLTETVSEYKTYLPKYFPIPHPSPTNRFWRSKNPWFEELVVPELQKKVKEILNTL